VSKQLAEGAYPPFRCPILSWLCFAFYHFCISRTCTATWTGMVSLQSENMPLSICPFPNRLPIDTCPLLHGPSVFPTKILLECLGLSDFLSSLVALSFQWVPGHARLPGNELTDSLAKTGVTLRFTHVHSPLAPVIAKIRHICYSFWRLNLFHISLFCQIPSVFLEELALSRLISCELSRFRCHGQSLLLSSILTFKTLILRF